MKQSIKTVKEFNQWRQGSRDMELGTGYATMLGRALDDVVKGAERYEFVRTLNVPQFKDLVMRNIAGEGKFDDLVDAMIEARK